VTTTNYQVIVLYVMDRTYYSQYLQGLRAITLSKLWPSVQRLWLSKCFCQHQIQRIVQCPLQCHL